MLNAVQPSSQLPPAVSPASSEPGDRPAAGAPVVPAEPAHPRPTVFEDLPAELIGQVAADVFRASVHDPRSRVESLACNDTLRATLADELHAGEVLRSIQASHDMPALCAALGEVRTVFPPLRDACLKAVLYLLPRTPSEKVLPEALWTPLDALLRAMPRSPPSTGHATESADPKDDLLRRLASVLHQHRRYDVGHVERVLGLLDPHVPPSPRLAKTLLLWAAQMLALPAFTGIGVEALRQRLVDATPPAFRSRMQRLCDFSAVARSTMGLKPPLAMASQIAALENMAVADLAPCLNMVGSFWRVFSRRSFECDALYKGFFQRLDPRQQVAAIMRGKSPALKDETASLLLANIGGVPPAVLLDTLRNCPSAFLDEVTPAHVALVRSLLENAHGTPQFATLLRKAITFRNANHEDLGPFLARQVALADDRERPALALRLGVKLVGSSRLTSARDPAFEAVSFRVNELLAGVSQAPAHAVETLVELGVGWLTPAQDARLMALVTALPPAACARCLVRLVRPMALHFPRDDAAALTRKVLALCARLPPEYQAEPLAHVEEVMRYLGPEYDDLRRSTALVRDALAPMLRPRLKRDST